MTLRMHEGKLLVSGGKLANSEDCCCEKCYTAEDCDDSQNTIIVRGDDLSPGDVVKVGDTCYTVFDPVACHGSETDSPTEHANCDACQIDCCDTPEDCNCTFVGPHTVILGGFPSKPNAGCGDYAEYPEEACYITGGHLSTQTNGRDLYSTATSLCGVGTNSGTCYEGTAYVLSSTDYTPLNGAHIITGTPSDADLFVPDRYSLENVPANQPGPCYHVSYEKRADLFPLSSNLQVSASGSVCTERTATVTFSIDGIEFSGTLLIPAEHTGEGLAVDLTVDISTISVYMGHQACEPWDFATSDCNQNGTADCTRRLFRPVGDRTMPALSCTVILGPADCDEDF